MKSHELLKIMKLRELFGECFNKKHLTKKHIKYIISNLKAKWNIDDDKNKEYNILCGVFVHTPDSVVSKENIECGCQVCPFINPNLKKGQNWWDVGCIGDCDDISIEESRGKIYEMIETYGLDWFENALLKLMEMNI